MAKAISIYTDGAAKGNPGPGGWGAILCDGENVHELGGADPNTTNNRMEMQAAIQALERIRTTPAAVAIYTDSTYLIKGITQWIFGWRRKGWKTAIGGEVLNRDLWERLASVSGTIGVKIDWLYVPGHAGVPGNERADTIASELALGNHVELFRGKVSAYDIDLTPPTGAAPPPRRRSKNQPRRAYSYLSLVGGEAQRHQTWAECKARVDGVSGARFKKALSATEESKILADWGVRLPKG